MKQLEKSLKKHADEKQAEVLQRFFKTGPGQYGEGDVFLGIKVPKQREIARDASKRLSLVDAEKLLDSEIHEKRMTALLVLIEKYKIGDEKVKKEIYDFYLSHTEKINNWDLVDLSSHKIIGDFLVDKDRSVLYNLAKSDNLWERRISIISCFAFIRRGDFKDALEISKILMNDSHDLIHKAVGWMLREIGKRDKEAEERFLKEHYKQMPRTMLRYAIEKFEEEKRKMYLLGEVE